ncbi:hypothetical protein CDAR_417501 [Caerostris darwini]|uniref:Uncharacterized protein n=1 Tax=Caerostris darwini TaxID=1538125 RepID=A0AAV4WEC1_9ARAC|nr:hypothetical protein CDAR_417501 [Caerostris darwini]
MNSPARLKRPKEIATRPHYLEIGSRYNVIKRENPAEVSSRYRKYTAILPPGSTPPNPPFTPKVCPLLRLGRASPLSATPPHLKIRGQCHRRKSRNPIECFCARNW